MVLYRHQPDRLVVMDYVTMMWGTTIPTAKKIKANHPGVLYGNYLVVGTIWSRAIISCLFGFQNRLTGAYLSITISCV